jgi:myosin-1
LEEVELKKTEYAFGRSKVFIRNPKSLFELEDKRRARNLQLAIKIQTIYRGWKLRSKYLKMRKAQVTIASNYKTYKARSKYVKMRNAAIILASYIRMWRCRKAYHAIIYAERNAMIKKEKEEAEARARAEDAERLRLQREAEERARKIQQEKERKAAVLIAAYMRGWLVRKRTHALFRLGTFSN